MAQKDANLSKSAGKFVPGVKVKPLEIDLAGVVHGEDVAGQGFGGAVAALSIGTSRCGLLPCRAILSCS